MSDDEEQCRDEPHRPRIGTRPDALDLAPCYRTDDANLGLVPQRLIQAPAAAGIHAVDVHVDETAQLARLVEEQVRYRQPV